MGRTMIGWMALVLAGCGLSADEFMLGQVRGPEACNGVDDDGNGIVDEWVGTYALELKWPTGLWAGMPPELVYVPVQVAGVAERTSVQTSPDGGKVTERHTFGDDGSIHKLREGRRGDGSLMMFTEADDGVDLYLATFTNEADDPSDLQALQYGWRLELDERGRRLREFELRGETSWLKVEHVWHDEADGGFARVTSRTSQESLAQVTHRAYDDQGRILWVANVLENGELDDMRTVYRYDGAHVVEVVQVHMGTGEEAALQSFTWTFSDSGHLQDVRREHLVDGESRFFDDSYQWDEHGRLVEAVQTQSDRSWDVVTRVTYDAGGWLSDLESTSVTWGVGGSDFEEAFVGLTTFAWDRQQPALTGRHAVLEGIPWGIDYDDTFICR